MSETGRWIAEIGPDGELSSHSYDGMEDVGSEGLRDTTYGESYFAIRRTREAAEVRVRELWERRIEDKSSG